MTIIADGKLGLEPKDTSMLKREISTKLYINPASPDINYDDQSLLGTKKLGISDKNDILRDFHSHSNQSGKIMTDTPMIMGRHMNH